MHTPLNKVLQEGDFLITLIVQPHCLQEDIWKIEYILYL